jgi:hypothetical protein
MPPRKKNPDTLSNFLPLNRKFFEHPFWEEERTFSKSEAWLDLIQLARFEESEAQALIGGKLVSWSKGQLPASLRYLAERWKWGKTKVSDFMDLLEQEGMIGRLQDAGQTILSLKSYEKYNKSGQRKGHENGQQNLPILVSDLTNYVNGHSSKKDSETDSGADDRRTVTGQAPDKTNKVNKEKEGIGTSASIHLQDDVDKYNAFTEWIKKNATNVSKMREPFSIEEYLKLRKKIPNREQVQALLLKMHNWQPLLKKNNSAYLTILNWNGKEYNNEPTQPTHKAAIV